MLLKRGDNGVNVRIWQEFLNTLGYKLTVDGDFGPAVEKATRSFQTANSLKADGVVDDDTISEGFDVFDGLEGTSEKPVSVPSNSHLDLFEGTKIEKINAAKLATVCPTLRLRGLAFIAAAKADGVIVQITQGLRTFKEQDALFAQGRTIPGRKVTNARGGQSMHNYGLALDFAPVVNGVVSFDEKLYKPFGKWADAAGLEWGGRWTKFVDLPHVQDTEGRSLKQIQELYRQGGLAAVWATIK